MAQLGIELPKFEAFSSSRRNVIRASFTAVALTLRLLASTRQSSVAKDPAVAVASASADTGVCFDNLRLEHPCDRIPRQMRGNIDLLTRARHVGAGDAGGYELP